MCKSMHYRPTSIYPTSLVPRPPQKSRKGLVTRMATLCPRGMRAGCANHANQVAESDFSVGGLGTRLTSIPLKIWIKQKLMVICWLPGPHAGNIAKGNPFMEDFARCSIINAVIILPQEILSFAHCSIINAEPTHR